MKVSVSRSLVDLKLFNMYPKTILMTGANRGIGLEFVKQLLRLHEPPTHIFAACRSPEKAEVGLRWN